MEVQSLITGGGGATQWENRGSKLFVSTPRQGQTSRAPPPLKNVETFCAPHSVWLKFKCMEIKLSALFFCRVKLDLPPLSFCNSSPPPFSIINDRSLLKNMWWQGAAVAVGGPQVDYRVSIAIGRAQAQTVHGLPCR